MDILRKLFGSKQSTALPSSDEPPKSVERSTSVEAGQAKPTVSIEAHKSIILKRASTIGIPQEVVETNLKNLSSEQLRLLAECADNLFMIYLWSPSGTEAKADAARTIGLRS